MTAEINLGNYDIDEDSNGNLIIKDSTGSTVLTHTDGNGWSFGSVSVDGITSLSTEQVSTDPPSNNGATRVYQSVDGVDNPVQTTTGVDTTATTILNPTDLTGACSLVLVSGDDGSGNRFKDLVFVSRGGANPTVLAQDSAGSPATRSYDSGSQDELLDLTMGSGSYKVRARGIRNGVL